MSRKCGRYLLEGPPKRPQNSLKKGSFLAIFRPKRAFIGGYLNNILLDGI
jgi:hypothetical protein